MPYYACGEDPKNGKTGRALELPYLVHGPPGRWGREGEKADEKTEHQNTQLTKNGRQDRSGQVTPG